jgi:uncharacterized protein YdaU (DUF1376 family)
MADTTPLPAENAEQPQAQTPEAQTTIAAAVQPQVEAQGEEWDPERAKATIAKLRGIEKQAKADAKELADLRAEREKRAEAELTEAQRLQKQYDELKAQNAKLLDAALRQSVIEKSGLPSELADRLKGATEEELLEDAKKLLAILPQPTTKPAPPSLKPTNPANGTQAETPQQQRERLFGKQGNPFDLDTIKAQGGGVFFNKD